MVLASMNNWEMEVVDIETTFLYRILEEEIFMKILEGLDVYKESDLDEDKCLVLDKVIYGLVQGARQFHKRLTKAMEDDLLLKGLQCPNPCRMLGIKKMSSPRLLRQNMEVFSKIA